MTMRPLVALCLVCVLTAACGTGWQAGGTQPPPAESTPQPTLEPALASSLLLQRRHEDAEQYEIQPIDPATGEAVAGVTPIEVGSDGSSTHTLSADGTRLAVVESRGQVTESYAGGTSYRPASDVLHLIEIRTQRVVTATLSGDGWVSALTFRPDASQLALAYTEPEVSRLMVFDAETGAREADRILDFRPSLLTYTEKGTTLVVYGQKRGVPTGIGTPPPPQVLLFDAGTLESLWRRSLDTVLSGSWCLEQCTAQHGRQEFVEWRPAVVPDRDGRRLYVVHADEDRLTTVEFDSGVVRSVLLREQQSWLDWLLGVGEAHAKGVPAGATKQAVLSRDGARLYLVVQTRNVTNAGESSGASVETDVAVRIIDVATGHLRASRDVDVTDPYVWIGDVWLTPNGTHLFVNGWEGGGQWTQVLDAQSLEPVTSLRDWQAVLIRRTDGEPVLMARRWRDDRQTEFAVLDPHTFEIGAAWTASDASLITP